MQGFELQRGASLYKTVLSIPPFPEVSPSVRTLFTLSLKYVFYVRMHYSTICKLSKFSQNNFLGFCLDSQPSNNGAKLLMAEVMQTISLGEGKTALYSSRRLFFPKGHAFICVVLALFGLICPYFLLK